jgi:hypothetical protein
LAWGRQMTLALCPGNDQPCLTFGWLIKLYTNRTLHSRTILSSLIYCPVSCHSRDSYAKMCVWTSWWARHFHTDNGFYLCFFLSSPHSLLVKDHSRWGPLVA